ncbi:MAG TPA: ATP-binding protein [Polyangiaceae bacterium]|nr:ATP-binding protein [Polyangiaceae bacterium]
MIHARMEGQDERVGRLETRLRVLSTALRAFAEATTDYERLLNVVAHAVSDVIADGCVVRLLSDGYLTPVAFHLPFETGKTDPTDAERVRRFVSAPQRIADYSWGEEMVKSGTHFLAARIDLTLVTPEVAEAYRVIGVHSLIVTTLRVNGETIGTLSLFRFRSTSPPFDEQDLEMAQGLADHASLAIANARLLQTAVRLEERTRRANETFRLLVDGARDHAIFLLDASGRVQTWNAGAERIHGYPESDIIGRGLECFYPGPDAAKQSAADLEAALRKGKLESEGYRTRRDGSKFWANVVITALGDGEHRLGFANVVQDLTDRRKLEAQYRQAQKMEAVGRLAGGVAHDFNNVLSVILSYAELAGESIRAEDPLRGDIEEIRMAGVRAAELTRQLLAFSRQQVLETKILDLGQSVSGMEKMLRRLLGADVELTVLCAPVLWKTRADPGQIEQVIMNLAVNARDAMPTGGKLTIETTNVTLSEEYAAAHHDVVPGDYTMLAVTDTGTGMSAETQARVFEPFFTTKEQGKGTGLGLATVFGIVKQSGGHIWIYSELGHGTTFKVYLPRVSGDVDLRPSERPGAEVSRGTETILLVEDDAQVRTLARNVLRQQGYVVLEAQNGGEAFLTCEQHGANIDLLLTDVVLPRMSGRQIAERLRRIRPTLKVLFMSGYTDDAVLQHGVLETGAAYLQKPLTPKALARKVRQVIDGE